MRPFVVIIDDSLVVRRILETTLKREGYDYASFPDAVEALQALMREPERVPDVIILDLLLPKMDGYDVIRYLRRDPHVAHLSGVRILIISRCDGTLDRLKGRLAGAQGYITKPFRTQEVIACLAALCRSQQGAADSPPGDGR